MNTLEKLRVLIPPHNGLPEQKNLRDIREYYFSFYEDRVEYKAVYTSDEIIEEAMSETSEEVIKKWVEGVKTYLHSTMKREHLGGVELNRMLNSWRVTSYSDTGANFTFYLPKFQQAARLRDIISLYIHDPEKLISLNLPSTLEL